MKPMTDDTSKEPRIVKLNNVRLAFPDLFKAAQFNGDGEPAFSATFLIDTGNDTLLNTLRSVIKKAAEDKWGAKAPAVLKKLKASGDKLCLRDGDNKAEYDGFEGYMFVSARTKTKPLVIDRNKLPLTEADGKPYAGCYVNGNIEIWAQDNKFGKRINATLRGVQFAGDGESFSGSRPADVTEFDDLGDEDTGPLNDEDTDISGVF
jgi:hypothetical protein